MTETKTDWLEGYTFKAGLTLNDLTKAGVPIDTFLPKQLKDNYPALMNIDVLLNLCNTMIEKGEPITLDTPFPKFLQAVSKAIQQGFLG
jgi:hypothetical protein